VENQELANAAWWVWFWELIGTISFFGVIVTLAIEFGAARLAAPYKEKLDKAREERISAATERAAKAELDLAQLQRIAPRILLPSRQEEMRGALSKFAGQVVTVGTTNAFQGVAEIESLGAQIVGTLRAAGWNVGSGQVTWGSIFRPTDVIVSAEEMDPKSKEAALALVRELENSSITAIFRSGSATPPDNPDTKGGMIKAPGVTVLIGTKP